MAKYDINRDGDDYVWKIKVGGSLVEVMRVTPTGSVTFTAGGSPSGSISSAGLWTIGPVGYAGTHQVNGNLSATGTINATSGMTGIGVTPVGTIVAWIPGYFADGSNGTYTKVLGTNDNISGANAYLASLGWCVCDGSAVNDVASPIFNGANRYVPNLTDKRFLQGSMSVVVQAGEVDVWNTLGNIQGGSLLMLDHTHAVTGVGVGTIDISHTHGVGGLSNVGESLHTHANTGLNSGGEASHTHGSTGLSGAFLRSDMAHTHGLSVSGLKNQMDNDQSTPANHTHSLDFRILIFTGPSGAYAGASIAMAQVGQVGADVTGGAGSHNHSWPAGTYFNSTGTSGAASWTGSQSVAVGGSTAAGASHLHSIPATSVGSSHTHTISGSTATGGSTTLAGPSLSGVTGTGNTAPNTDNRPKYLRCFMIIRFK